MKLGAEPKKIAVLAGILGVGAAVMFLGGDAPAGPKTPAAAVRPAAKAPAARPAPVRNGKAEAEAAAATITRPALRAAVQEFKPVLKSARAEDRMDPATIDPTLRLELIRRLSGVQIEGGNRTIFDFGAAPPPKQPDPPKIFPKPTAVAAAAAPPPVSVTPAAPVKPAAPPIRLKFYGFVGGARAKTKRAFFLDGEDIFVAGEGDVIQKRYRVVRIGLNSVVVEDQEFQSEQTLSLEQAESLE